MSAAAAWYGRPDEEIVARSLAAVTRLFGDLGRSADLRPALVAAPAAHPARGVPGDRRVQRAGMDGAGPIQHRLSRIGQNTAVTWGKRAAANMIRRSR